MSRVLVLIVAFLFFRAVLPRASRWSPTAITPYGNGLDGMMTVQQMSSILDESAPYESWHARHGAKVLSTTQDGKLTPNSNEVVESAAFAVGEVHRGSLRP